MLKRFAEQVSSYATVAIGLFGCFGVTGVAQAASASPDISFEVAPANFVALTDPLLDVVADETSNARVNKSLLLVVGASGLCQSAGGFQTTQASPPRSMADVGPYEPIGVPVGSFLLYPTLALSVGSSSNVQSAETNPISDTIITAAPAARLISDWNNHQLGLSASSTSRFYGKTSGDNATDWNVGGNGRLDYTRGAYVYGDASYASSNEPRSGETSSTPLAALTKFRVTEGRIGAVTAFNRVRLIGQVKASKSDYDNNRFTNGTVFFQQDRNRTQIDVMARGEYEVSPATWLFTAVTWNTRDYELKPPSATVDRNSDGFEALAGVRYDLTRLLIGEAGIGYLNQRFDSKAFADSSAVAVRANLSWMPTPLWNVSLNANRGITDAGVAGASSYIGNNLSVDVAYDIRSNITLGLNGSYGRDDYDGVIRKDQRQSFGASATYKLNRAASLVLLVGHNQQTSTGRDRGRDYEATTASLGLKLQR
jgi:hypothetical protein